jgi:hypothetical protein
MTDPDIRPPQPAAALDRLAVEIVTCDAEGRPAARRILRLRALLGAWPATPAA